jgi:hypothetical protein
MSHWPPINALCQQLDCQYIISAVWSVLGNRANFRGRNLAKRLLARPLAVGHHETALTKLVGTPPRQSVESRALGRNSTKASADIGTSSLQVSARAPTKCWVPFFSAHLSSECSVVGLRASPRCANFLARSLSLLVSSVCSAACGRSATASCACAPCCDLCVSFMLTPRARRLCTAMAFRSISFCFACTSSSECSGTWGVRWCYAFCSSIWSYLDFSLVAQFWMLKLCCWWDELRLELLGCLNEPLATH